MTYATRTNLVDRYGSDEVTQRETFSANVTTQALADADAQINAYVSGRYTVPLSPVPPNILKVACSIARYYMLGDAVTETARSDFDDAMKFLRDVQAGKALLEDATPLTGSAPSNRVSVVTNDRVFTRSARDL